ncbi:MAG TPA: GNAT family N-acetyltransferase [Anaerolineales bacterium]|nr:GNAT family N-acetyltransferase [Anaerolineales bacterium]
MEFEFVRNDSGFSALAEKWNQLLARSVTDVPFMRHEFLQTWWSTLGGGEWRDAELNIGVARDLAGDLVGLAPFFRTRTLDDRPGLLLLGSIEISDYLDLIAPEAVIDLFAENLLKALAVDPLQAWEVIDLYNVLETSPTLDALRSAAENQGWTYTQTRFRPSPVVELPDDWEMYLAGLGKKQRHELRRKMRRAAELPEGVEWRIIGSGDDVEQAVETFLRIMALDERKAGFLTPIMQTQIKRSAMAAHAHGWLQLVVLDIGGRPAAGYLNFDYGGRLWVYNSFIDPEYFDSSPGWVLLGHVIRWAISNGRREVDFLRGGEQYKYQLGGRERFVCRLTIERR